MRVTSRRFSECLWEAKQLLNAIDPELTLELKEEIRKKIIRKITDTPDQADQLDQITVKNIVYSLLLKKYLNKDNKCLHNNPNTKPYYWIRRCNRMNAQAEAQKNLPQGEE